MMLSTLRSTLKYLIPSRVVVGSHFNLRIPNGIIKRICKRKTNLRINSRSYLSICSLPVVLLGCGTMKKAGLVGVGALVPGAIASIATSGTAPVLVASAVGASVTSVVVDSTRRDSMPTVASCAPDNFWTLLGDLVSMGGWFLILVVIVPMVLGWLLPGPLERKKR